MTAELALSDPRFEKKERHGAFDSFWLRFIRDERDLPFIHLSVQMTVVLFAAAVALYWPGVFRWWMAPVYWAVLFGMFFDKYILMLHNTSHRPLFKKELDRLNGYIPTVLGPFAGQSPGTYFAHHIGMHHAEGNLKGDLSTTMPFRRDSLLHFLAYWARFFFLAMFELSAYHAKRKNSKHLRRVILGELSWYALAVGLSFVSFEATLVVFLVPFFMARFLMMAGNWAQHAFIDPADPKNDYKSSITCVNTRYNRRCFNDGYHIGHHEMAARHWTDMPADFEKKRQRYVDNDAVVFEGIDYFQIWGALMLRQYGWLADHFVDLREEPRSKEEIVALLRSRTKVVPFEAAAT